MLGIMKYYKIWLPLLSIVLFAGFAEMICRIFDLSEKLDADFKFITRDSAFYGVDYIQEDPFLMWSLKPGRHYGDAGVIINSQGFRGREYTKKKDGNVFRILCLGDSSTFGVHVQQQETYAARLEDRLNRESGGKTRYEVINAGVEGYSSCQGLAFYRLKGYEYAPDIVTFYFGLTDEKKKYSLSDRQLMQKDGGAAKAIRASLENNFLLSLHSYRIFRKYINRALGREQDNTFKKVTRVELEDFRKNILELNGLCRKNGAVLVLISPPLEKEGYPYSYAFPYRVLLENISGENNIPLVNIPEMTERSPIYTTPFFLDRAHPNPLGHRIIMEKIHDHLLAGRLLPGNPRMKEEQPPGGQAFTGPENAVDDYSTDVKSLRDNAGNYKKAGTVWYKQGRYQRAIENFTKAIGLNPDDAGAFNDRGGAFAKLGRYQQALEDYNEAIRLKPDYAVFYSNRGVVYLTRGDTKQGCRDVNRACDLGDCAAMKEAQSGGYCR